MSLITILFCLRDKNNWIQEKYLIHIYLNIKYICSMY